MYTPFPDTTAVNAPSFAPLQVIFLTIILSNTGTLLIVTGVEVKKELQPPEAAIVYDTVYVPGVLVAGAMAPLDESIVRPAVELKIPPPVPVKTTGCVTSLPHISAL